MQEDRAPWWFFLPVLVLVMGVVPASGLQNLINDSLLRSEPSPAITLSEPDVVRQIESGTLSAAVESTPNKLPREIQPFGRALLPDLLHPMRGVAAVPAALLLSRLEPGRDSMLFQFHTLSLQL